MRKLSQQAHPKVSVVIPIYNIEKYLAQTLDSVISQTLRDIEIICVDDGSSDQTAEILKKYADSDERIIVFRQENQGNFIAANSGIKLARGEYVSFCDHDDLMKQDQLETLYNLAKENNLDSIQIIPDVIFETSKIKRKYQGYLSYYHFDFQVKDVMSGSDLYNTISAQRVILPAPWTFFINRRLFLDNDFVYRGHILNEDEVFATKVFIYSRRMMLYADTLLYTRRIRVDSVMTSITYKEKTASYDSCAKLLQELLPTLEDAQKRKIVLERIDFLCQLSIDNRKMGQKLDKNAITLRNSEQQYFEERAKEALDAARFDKKIIALYLPAFHQIDINDKAWGFGFTEWDNVRTGEARYVGHRQPLVPHEDIGFYDLSKPEVLESQIKLAKHYGIYGFQFYYYWFDGKRVFDKPLSSLFKQKNWDFHFSICWANENWSKRWDGRDNDVIISQNYADGYELRFIKDVEDILNDPRYITIDGKPLLTIYRVDHLPDVRNFAHTVREYFREKTQ
ncbi:hypothetical protein FACS1894185_4710 [Betaproteobacteria bacterium]|nr:hypothetical protein FACS1894185_4710 [Betaproteobacteria bacterium]